MSSADAVLERPSGASTPLDVRISVDAPAGCDCSAIDGAVSDVQQSLTRHDDGTWTCDMVLEDADGCEYHQHEVCDSCPCYVLATQECIPKVLDVRNGRMHYSITIPDRSKLAPLVECLRATGSSVSVYRILVSDECENEGPTLTDKQRETLELAIDRGYFDRPRGATLAEIADELDVTTSAVSQRLSSVNRRLIKRYAEDACLDEPE